MPTDETLTVEVAYALPELQDVVALKVACGTTVEQAIVLSGIPARHAEVELESLRAGIHGRTVPRDTVLEDGDRVEIYRPLVADPKQARRRRAAVR